MKQDLENCPWCGNVLEKMEKEKRHCFYCNKYWNGENKIEEYDPDEEYQKPKQSKPESYFFNKREPNGDAIPDREN